MAKNNKVARPTFWFLIIIFLVLTAILTAQEIGLLGESGVTMWLSGITLIGGAIVLASEILYNKRAKVKGDPKIMIWTGAEAIVAIFAFFIGLGLLTATDYIPAMFMPVISIMRILLLMFLVGEVLVVK